MIETDTIIDGRYRVISRLGSGGMADVYLAHDQLLGREVAVKILHHHFAEDGEFVERFRREASSAAALSHPNIVAIFDRGEWDGTYYIAMEYVPGRTLKQIVREHGALEPTLAIDIVLQILQAARVAHRRGVIHRDLKPHNVILDDEGRARVTDFGIARAGASDMTLTGSIMGTAQYLSPEQAQGYTVTASSDLYSVGVILYELLTGVVPFEGETAVAIAFKQVSASPRPPSELNPAIPPSLDAVVLRALAKEPAERYPDAESLAAALQRERAALPAGDARTTVQPPAGEPPVPPPNGPMRMAVAEPEEPEDPEAEAARRRKLLLWGLGAAILAAIVVAAILLISSRSPVTVPSVTGQSEGMASATLRADGLEPVPAPVASATVAPGTVVSQSPTAGSSVSKGAKVTITVSAGPGNTPLPDVTGLTASKALSELKAKGLQPVRKDTPSKTVASGTVISTNPAPGTIVQVGTPVTVTVSSGPAPVKVPDLTGQTLPAAEEKLKAEGLEVGKITQRESPQPAGTVLSQSPSRGSSVSEGSPVELTVATASTQTLVPELVGKTNVEAAAELATAGLKRVESSVNTTENEQVGRVLSQSPKAGTKLKKGESVTVGVGVLESTTTTGTTSTPTTTTPAPGG